MELVFLTDHMKFSGGRRLMFDYANYLMGKGHKVTVLVNEERGELAGTIPVSVVPEFSAKYVPKSDLIIATSPKEVRQAWECKTAKVVHFCQGFELTDLEQRLSGKVLPPRYEGSGFMHALMIFKKKFTWRRKLREFDNVYKLPTYLISVSAHLQKELEERYGRPAPLCRNGVDLNNLHPRSDWNSAEKFSEKRPLRIINIGPINVTYKGIATTLEAVEKAKKNGMHIEFTRITPIATKTETPENVPYKLYEKLPRGRFCEVLRNNDVYISNSTEREGFGLPAMEALASGLICILSNILCYRTFTERKDHCIFVPEFDTEATLAAIERIYNMPESEKEAFHRNALAVGAEYSHDKACMEFENILEKIIKS